MESDTFVFFVNGKKISDDAVDPDWTLLRYLREKLLLPGTKMGCAEGGCGACTVMISKIDRKTEQIRHFSANSCLMPICSLYGLSVTTVEGIGSVETRIHPVQERLAKAHGSQCGFCTPGFVMSMYTLLRNCPKPTMDEIEESLIGNLCRCTGYRPILEGFRTFAKEDTPNGCGRSDCCKLANGSVTIQENELHKNGIDKNTNESGFDLERTAVLFDVSTFASCDPSQEVIFPPELKLTPELDARNLTFKSPRTTFFRPSTLDELLQLKNSFPRAKVVVGNTEVGIEVKFKNQQYKTIIHPGDIPELLKIEIAEEFIEVGAALPLTEIENAFGRFLTELPDYKTGVLRAMVEMLRWFAGRQIKNVAGLGGNIMTGSPISDLNPILMAAGARLIFKSFGSERETLFDDKFYIGYRRNTAKSNEVLTSVKIPFTSMNEYFMAYKQARRRDDDIAIVNASMMASIEAHSLKVTSITLAFGGMAPTTIMAKETMEKLSGCVWNDDLLKRATDSLLQEMRLDPSAPGGMVDYRRALTASFFFKFYLYVRQGLHTQYPRFIQSLEKDEEELIRLYKRVPVKSTQFFQNVPAGQERIDPVGRPVQHLSSFKQTTGEALFIDDLPHLKNELFAALVLSTRPHAKIIKIDESAALSLDEVEGFYCAKDVPGENKYGFTVEDQEFFASAQVHCVGEVIGIIVAKDQSLAQRAARTVKISYEDLPNPIFTIQQAIKENSMCEPIIVDGGNVDEGLRASDFILEGELYVGGQEHFYMESNVHLAIPHEGGEIEVISSSQDITGLQSCISSALGIPNNLVTCKTKRIGGGFGGKETRPLAICVPVCIAAIRSRRPVRIVLDRDEDMLITGGRNPFLGRWKVGFDKDGKLGALDLQLYANIGYSIELSLEVLSRAVLTANNAYNIKNMKVTGHGCKTNLPTNTAFRGFGTPQAYLIMEDIISRVSEFLKKDSRKVRELNLNESDCITYYGQPIENSNVQKCWKQVIESADYENRDYKIKAFNRENRYKKRGLSVIPLTYGVAFGPFSLNQAGALVLVYRDGSILISHGGIEMGQGIHTKMIQVASRILQIPPENIYIAETSTDKVPNTSPTAASSTSDLCGMAILNACEKILERLSTFKKEMPDGQWKDWVNAAYSERVSLTATGFYKTPDIYPYCPKAKMGRPFNYFCYGSAVSEVEVDCLTGDHTVLRSDIVMDVGNSLNPAIDIGQIEGAFMQGYGLYTMEQLVFSSSGALLTRGPGTYKIPSVVDIPREFNVSLLRGSSNPRAVFSSKAVGEPPLFLSASVFFAIREAVKAARDDGGGGTLQFNSPATAERIRMACSDSIIEQIEPAKPGTFQPWSLDV